MSQQSPLTDDTCLVCALVEKARGGSPLALVVVSAMNYSAAAAKTGDALPICPAHQQLAERHLDAWLSASDAAAQGGTTIDLGKDPN